MCAPRFPPPGPLRSGNISPCRAARSDREPAQACTLRTGYCEDGHNRCVASGQTSNHLKWSDLDCFSQGRREAAPRNSFSYQTEPYESNGTDQRKSCEDRTGSRPIYFGRRVRSWLRMNAGGAPNTCKSNGTPLRREASGERLSNTWRTCPLPRDSRPKGRVIPDTPGCRMAPRLKPRREGMAPRPIR